VIIDRGEAPPRRIVAEVSTPKSDPPQRQSGSPAVRPIEADNSDEPIRSSVATSKISRFAPLLKASDQEMQAQIGQAQYDVDYYISELHRSQDLLTARVFVCSNGSNSSIKSGSTGSKRRASRRWNSVHACSNAPTLAMPCPLPRGDVHASRRLRR
jgi:hypothetical protein